MNDKKTKCLFVFGTRPEAIKLAPVIKKFEDSHTFDTKVCITAQHRQMLDQVLSFFDIVANYDLDLMKPSQNLYKLTANIIIAMRPVLENFKPHYVFVHGDTTTTMSASIASFYFGAKICHIEAGLRTYNPQSPFPEEINRQLTGRLTTYHFSPTQSSKNNLLREYTHTDNILVTGNTVIDSLFSGLEKIDKNKPAEVLALEKRFSFDKPIILVTGHRRENFGQGFLNICQALKDLAHKTAAEIIYPVHLNPNVQQPVNELLGDMGNIHLIAPQTYPAFIWLMNTAKLIITDSGGVQEEAPSLGKPVLVMRETTERPEAVAAGTVILVGTNQEKIVAEALSLLTDEVRYQKMNLLRNPYGDGKASKRILDFMLQVVAKCK